MRVAAVLQTYPPRTVIGAYLATHQFLTALAARGHQVQVHRGTSRPRGLRETIDGVEVLPPSGKSINDPTHPIHPIHHTDLVISHLGKTAQAAGTGPRIAARLGVPSVRLAHSPPDDALDQLDGCQLLIANSHATATAIGWDGPTVICPPPTWPDQHTTTPGGLVTQINLQEAKGGRLFWDLAARLDNVEFLAVAAWGTQIGPGGERVDKLAVPATPPPNVTWQRPTRDMRRDVWARTRVLLMPSVAEAWGMTGVEACCSGIPVIASDLPGLHESLGDAATFLHPDDVDGWAAAIERLNDPDEWETASDRATARATELDPQGSVDRFCDATEQIGEPQ